MQPDPPSNLISTNINSTGGVGLGLFFTDQSDFTVSIENCTFRDNVAYKPANYNSSKDTRPSIWKRWSYLPAAQWSKESICEHL